MTRTGSKPIGGQAELLAACLSTHPTKGEVTLAVTGTAGAISVAKLTSAGTADEAFATCLTTKIIGMPFATAGDSSLTLTAM